MANTYLNTVEEIRTGGQSGVDQACIEHALRNGVTVGGWVPACNTAEVLVNGTYVDQAGGIPEWMLRAGKFVETTAENVGAFLTERGGTQDGTLDHLLAMAGENPSNPAIRTELQVITTDATLIVTTDSPALTDGTTKMKALADHYRKPCFIITLRSDGIIPDDQITACRQWILAGRYRALNVGGPRASHDAAFGHSIAALSEIVFDRLYATQPRRV